ncbi:hypothetical protein TRVA0_004S03884 [Trichomonascus vanleenenianus]|uniref:pepsin-like aspartic protease n=1 Tax=Trichomonascus vanleenenianus TaxID=2268995 RepID=UPI003ECA5520
MRFIYPLLTGLLTVIAEISFPLTKRDGLGTSSISALKHGSKDMGAMVLVAEVIDGTKKAPVIKSSGTDQVSQDGKDIAYYVDIEIGSQDQKFALVVDTGSYYTWVYGKNCTSDSCKDHQLYDNSLSDHSQATPHQFSVSYTSGDVEGQVFTDVMSIAGFKTIMDFGAASNAGNTFANFDIDGLLGLSAKDKSHDFPTIISTLREQNLISSKTFGINLGRSADQSDEGALTIGGLDSSKYTGDISWTDVTQNSVLWEIPVDYTSMGGNKVDFGGDRTAVVDTGTTLVVMSKADALKLHSYFDGSQTDGQNFAIPCDTNTTLDITFSGVQWPILPEDYIGEQLKSGLCASNIQGLDISDTQWILGDMFLKGVYAAFDMDNQRVGFAQKKSCATTDTPENSIVYSSLKNDDEKSKSFTSAVTTMAAAATTSASATAVSANAQTTGASNSTVHRQTASSTKTSHSGSNAAVSVVPNLLIFAPFLMMFLYF